MSEHKHSNALMTYRRSESGKSSRCTGLELLGWNKDIEN